MAEKHLYLVRHAEAVVKESRQDDHSRELTPAGVKDALHLGAWLKEQKHAIDLLVSSSALRAEQTTTLIAETLNLDRIQLEDLLYEAPVRHLLEYVNNLDDGYSNVLLTGHNPGLTYFAEYLTKADIGDMVPGRMVIVRFDVASWKEVGEGMGSVVGF